MDTIAMAQFDNELVSGHIFRSVWKLTWPVVLLNLINGIHSLVDHILVGHFVPSSENVGNAAIGVAWQVFLVVIVGLAFLSHGMNVLIARYAGQQDQAAMSHVFYQAVLTAIYLSVGVIAPLGYFLSPWLVRLAGAPEAVEGPALTYLRFLFVLGMPLFLMFVVTGAFHSSGDPRTPLKLGILTTILNVVLSSIFIIGPGPLPPLGVTGAALGTVLAPLLSLCIAFNWVRQGKMLIQRPKRITLIPDKAVIKTVARIGVPAAIQGVLLNIGGVFLFYFAGKMNDGAAVQAAYTICYAQLFALISWAAFGLRVASATVMGQNIGAGDPHRGKRAVLVSALLGGSWAAVLGVLFWVVPVPLLRLFGVTDEPLLSYGVLFLRFLGPSGVFLAVTLALTGGLQGAGYTKVPMYIAAFTQIIVLLGICTVLYQLDQLTPSRIWAAILISHCLRLLLTALVFRPSHWVHTEVELERESVDLE